MYMRQLNRNKITSSGDQTWDPWSLGPIVLDTHIFLTKLTSNVLTEGHLTSRLFVHKLTFELIKLKSIEYDFIRI